MRINHLGRRELIALLAGAVATWPRGAGAQQPRKPARLGYIWIGSKGSEHSTLDGIRQGLGELGYAEGRDFMLEDRYADSQPERLPAIVAELLRLKVDLFLSPGNPVTRAVMQGTSTIPIIATTPDLLASGFVASLARPGGNVTGISLTAGATLSEKWLEILKETFPNVTKVAVLSNLTLASSAYLDQIRMAASVLGVQPQFFAAQDPVELDRALAAMTAMMPDGLVVESDATLVSNRAKIIAFAAQYRLPAVYGNLDYIPDGGLMAYYTSIVDAWRRLASYVDKVLKGVKPSDLPVQQATRFELLINLKTAQALGLTIPPMILIRADNVIE
jgi:putative ABC transport system substrate-binding protein